MSELVMGTEAEYREYWDNQDAEKIDLDALAEERQWDRQNLCGGNYCRRHVRLDQVQACQGQQEAGWNGRCVYQRGRSWYPSPLE